MARPRSVSLPPEEMINLGKEMVEWVIRNNPIHIKQWYSIEKGFLFSEWDTMQQCPEFFPYYEQAMNLVSLNYINGTINPSIAQRFMRIYFKDVRLQENEDLDAAAKRSKEIAEVHAQVTPEFAALHNDMMANIKNAHSERKMANNSIKEDTKS